MGGDEVEVGGTALGRRHTHQPVLQVSAVAGHQGIEQQRRQREIVDAVGLVAVAEVGQVFAVGNIGLGDNHGVGPGMLHQGAQQAHHLVGLLQVDAAGAGDLPQESHGIQPEDTHPLVQVMAQDGDKLLEYLRVAKIQVYLVVAEGTPYMAGARGGFHLAQQRRGARAHHGTEVVVGAGGTKIPRARGAILQEVLEPQAASRAVVDDQVRHQVVVAGDGVDIGPVAQ